MTYIVWALYLLYMLIVAGFCLTLGGAAAVLFISELHDACSEWSHRRDAKRRERDDSAQ